MKGGRGMSAYISIKKQEPDFGVPIYIKTRDGKVYEAMKTETVFYDCGYCYEDIDYADHKREEVVAWKPID